MTKLRVAHIITNLSLGGATENTLACCKLADTSRIEPSIVCGERDPGETTLIETARSSNIPVHIIPNLTRAVHAARDFQAYRELVDWLRRYPVDVVHTHGSKAGILGRMAAAKASVPVIVHTVHGWGHHDHMPKSTRFMYVVAERMAAKVSNKIITVSIANTEKGLADGIGVPAQYVTIRSGINLDAFRTPGPAVQGIRESVGIPGDAPVVGTVSRLAQQKAPLDFVETARLVSARVPSAHFVFVGGGPLEKELLQAVARAGISHQFHYLGFRNDIPVLLRAFDVFVLSSLWEGLPRVFPQAMCAGLPIVATNVDGAAEAVAHGVNGYLTEPGNPKALADFVVEILNDADLRAEMGAAGLVRVDPMFSDLHMTRQVEDLYRSEFESLQHDVR